MLTALLLALPAEASPELILAGGVGLPNLLQGHAEVFLSDAWSLELGGGFGELPPNLEVATRWTPPSTCWSCGIGSGLRLAPGIAAFLFPQEIDEVIVVLDADIGWLYQGPKGRGVTAGVKVGAGISLDQVVAGLKIEPAVEVVPLQIGVMR